ncbi:sigma-54 interaction domain-containing protein [Paludibacterium purpuratum]|uniref:Arginine utilization regulatory protein n=1 Tax=Paludibacterium purpuratum TaxID=1144873 RepID=A0A4R7B280_9NEIS|nr:sigma 54-interacting transcriptional regulator [Paludibacterium purpuratum]TDR77842.1 arginine utilization regulatory protein [Paludibacterium purpuratum]
MSSVSPELELALQIFARFFDLIHQPITIIDQAGKFVYYNQESAEIDGYRGAQALGKHFLDVYNRLPEEKSTMLGALHHGTEYIGNYQIYYNYKGRPVDYQHTTVPLFGHDGIRIGAIEIGRDVSNVRKLQQQVVELNQLLYSRSQNDAYPIITCDDAMCALIKKTKRMALNDAPVVIVGETGTGKELFARLLHQSSKRADRPFIALNCGALPAQLIESTLFGTVKGAYTGAENSKGYLELADGGTLFLDEMNEMPLAMQSKLLRFLQDKSFWKLGGNQELHSDVRIIAAMNETPAYLIQQKRLRNDLFYRLCVGVLSLPPLSARLHDIEVLALHFIEKHGKTVGQHIHGISSTALSILKSKPWPGNVRMLENVIVRSMMTQEHDGLLTTIAYDEEIYELPESPAQTKSPPPQTVPAGTVGNLTHRVEAFERKLIIEALNAANGRVAQAAETLAISRTTLHYKIKKYEINFGVLDD